MRKQTGLTRIDLAVVLACIALVLAQAGAINAGGRERSKREVCLANLRMLTAAWQMYADDNAGKIVNGGQALGSNYSSVTEPFWCTPLCNISHPLPTTDDVGTGWPAIRYDWDTTAASGVALPYAERVSLLKRGALYGYVQNPDIYRCPEADKTAHRSYVIPCSMNALCDQCGYPSNAPVVKSLGQIVKPNERIVFLEEKRITPDAFQFPYSTTADPYWVSDLPNITHSKGANYGFADGHADYFQWKCQSTLALCQIADSGGPVNLISFKVQADAEKCGGENTYNGDAKWVENAVWGD
jgi:prepilin-type processing-associated H-X9-DG protein